MEQRNDITEEQEFLNAENEADNEAITFDIRKPLASKGCVRFPNGVRPMIQFVPTEQSTVINNYNKVVDRITELNDTTESRLADVREQMTFTKAKKTIRNTGHYFTEPYPACGEYMTTEEIKTSIADVFGA